MNIETELFTDIRFKKLTRDLGDEYRAIGMLVQFWLLAQKFWGQNQKLVPVEQFEMGGFQPLLDCRLVELRSDGYYAKGAEKQFDWYLQRVSAGKSRAKAERAPNGRFKTPAEHQRESSENPAVLVKSPASSQPLTPTPTPALSSTSSSGEKNLPEDLRTIIEKYQFTPTNLENWTNLARRDRSFVALCLRAWAATAEVDPRYAHWPAVTRFNAYLSAQIKKQNDRKTPKRAKQ